MHHVPCHADCVFCVSCQAPAAPPPLAAGPLHWRLPPPSLNGRSRDCPNRGTFRSLAPPRLPSWGRAALRGPSRRPPPAPPQAATGWQVPRPLVCAPPIGLPNNGDRLSGKGGGGGRQPSVGRPAGPRRRHPPTGRFPSPLLRVPPIYVPRNGTALLLVYPYFLTRPARTVPCARVT